MADPHDLAGLAADLHRHLDGEVRFDAGSRALYATDASNYRQVPVGVVLPRTTDDIEAAVAVCREHDVPVVGRGGGTSLAGQCCNVAVVIDTSKHLRQIRAIDPGLREAVFEPGVVLDELRGQAERHMLTFGPDPATHNRCTLGGMIGNNSCGVHALMAGKTADNIDELEVLTYDGLRLRVGATSDEELEKIIAAGGRRGEIYASLRDLRDHYGQLVRDRFPRIPRRVSGFNLDQLLPEHGFHLARALVGTESTCVLVLSATGRLVASPPGRALVVLGYPDVYTACDQVPELLQHGPIGLEGFDDLLVADVRDKGLHPEGLALLPEGRGWLLVEFGGESPKEAKSKAEKLAEALSPRGTPVGSGPMVRVLQDPAEVAHLWAVRESALGATARMRGHTDAWPGWEDSAVAPEHLGGYLRDLRALLDRYRYGAAFYGHFGQGCLHTRVTFDLETSSGVARMRSFVEEAADLVVGYGGSLSGEHGDGQARGELLPKMFGDELVRAFGEFKGVWDPANRMNPGKVVAPAKLDQHLRLGPSYRPIPVKTAFTYPDDEGSFARAALRCVGVGKCRRTEGGVMCPSYMVTREEEHSTRGRAHLLFEMLNGEELGGGWRDPHVRDALDLCLACKGCKGECPVNVDMATYKAEFLSHYYRRRLRPRSAYSMGLVMYTARLASRTPRLANSVAAAPGLSVMAKLAAGVHPHRKFPTLAHRSFRRWFTTRLSPSSRERPSVLLWPDTFTNYFQPRVAQAAVSVLESVGFSVRIPEVPLCCGRPLYDYGFLGEARRLLKRTLSVLGEEIRAGMPIVVLEPSCASVFRDELVNLLAGDERPQRLSDQAMLFSEFLQRHAPDADLGRIGGSALVQGHCHQKALMGMSDDQIVLGRLGIDAQVLDSGCCGMAGAFGFERDHYEVSMAVGERVLLPAIRSAAPDVRIVADGFSCREQISQCTNRRAEHLAEVVAAGLPTA